MAEVHDNDPEHPNLVHRPAPPPEIGGSGRPLGQPQDARDLRGFAISEAGLLDYLVNRASESAFERVQEVEMRRLRFITLVLSIVGLLGTAGVTFSLTYYLKSQVEEQLTSRSADLAKSVMTEVSDQFGAKLVSELAGSRFSILATQLDLANGFSEDELASAREFLRQIAGVPDLMQRAEFPSQLEKVVDAFAAANRGDAIDDLVNLEGLRPTIERTSGIRATLTEHYGKRFVVGDASNDELQTIRKRFYELVKRHDPQNRSGVTSLFRLLVAAKSIDLFKEGDGEGEIDRIAHLPADQQQDLLHRLAACQTFDFWGSQTMETDALASACTVVDQRYGKQVRAAVAHVDGGDGATM